MAKGSALARAVRFFREGDIDEVRVARTLVNEVVDKRLGPQAPRAKKAGRPKKAKANGTAADTGTDAQGQAEAAS